MRVDWSMVAVFAIAVGGALGARALGATELSGLLAGGALTALGLIRTNATTQPAALAAPATPPTSEGGPAK